MECDKCGKPMTLRTAKTGKNAGNQFWGCSGFPDCKNIMEGHVEKPIVQPPKIAMHDIVISRTEKPHSYEFGKAGNRHKIYYEEISELKAHIDSLKENGLYDETETIKPEELGS